MVERASLEQYRQANTVLSARVQAAVSAFFASLDLSRPEAARDALLAFLPTLTEQYGYVAATIAADWYEEQRAAAGAVGSFRALTAASVPAVAVESKVRYLAGHLWTPTPGAMLGGLVDAADKYVKQPGRDTIAVNARREGVRWARVPTGPTTCSFCLVLASRDAIYRTKQAAGDQGLGVGDRFHGKCDCQVVPIRSESDYPAGYLPDDYRAMYEAAVNDNGPEVRAFLGSLPADDPNKQLKAAVFSMRRQNPGLVTDGVHSGD